MSIVNCRAPADYLIGATSQCNVATDCNWCERNGLSMDFLCCETGMWLGPHFTNPLLFYLVWNSVPYTVILVLSYEILEVLLLVVFGGMSFVFTNDTDFETLAAALIGDVLIQAGSALIVGYCLRALFLVPTLVSSKERARAYDLRGRRVLYIVLYLALLSTYALVGTLTPDDDSVRGGLMLQTGIELVFIWLVFPVFLTADYDREMIWRRQDGTYFEGTRKTVFFLLWGLIVLTSHALHFASLNNQPIFSFNEWYVQWTFTGPLTALLLIITFIVSWLRRDTYTAWITVGIVLFGGGLVIWFSHHILQETSDTMLWIGGVLVAIGAIIFMVVGSAVDPTNAEIDGTTRKTDSAVESTRLGSRTIHNDVYKQLLNKESYADAMIVNVADSTLRRRIGKDIQFD